VADVLPLPAPAPNCPHRRRRSLSPLLVDARRLARLLCCGVRTVRAWDAAGKLPAPVKIGGRVLWPVEEVKAWVRAGCPCRAEWSARRAAAR
jgi:excisionase family DNA binding protein